MSPVKFAILLIAEGPWRRLNSNQMCFGAGDKQSGGFVVEVDGLIDAVKLVHLYGQVSCDVSNGRWSKWGCGAENLMVFLTNFTDDILIPKVEGGKYKYKIEGYKSKSPEIIWKDFTNPIRLTSGQELRLWRGMDLVDKHEPGQSYWCF